MRVGGAGEEAGARRRLAAAPGEGEAEEEQHGEERAAGLEVPGIARR
jgi:hypothetical protein